MTRRLRRSELSTPGSSERMMASAAGSDADLVFLDLEDSVVAHRKPEARGLVTDALRALDWGRKSRGVRVNAVGSEWVYEDLVHVMRDAGDVVDVLIVPKVRSPRDVRWVDGLVTELERGGRPSEPVGLEVLIEEAEALARVEEIARSSDRLEALIFGSGDLAASLGFRTRRLDEVDGDVWSYHRQRIVVAAHAAGIDAIDGPYWGPIDDLDGYRRESDRSSILGFGGKWAIHPGQIPIANEAFSPTADEIDHAERLVAAYRAAEREGRGSIRFDGAMVDAVDLRLAEAVLDRAATIAAATWAPSGPGLQ